MTIHPHTLISCLVALSLVLMTTVTLAHASEPLQTRWATQVDPENPRPEYPRPQMVRDQWLNLNGQWHYAVTEKTSGQPDEWEPQKITVPFPIESTLSRVSRAVTPDEALWYRRTFAYAPPADDQRVLLHFGAVDWYTRAWINGRQVGEHKGGYDAFTFDVTEALQNREGTEPHEIVVRVWDPTDASFQPRGKQVRQPGGIWYTAVTGIWQTVWLETVPASSIESFRIMPDVDAETLTIETKIRGPVDDRMQVRIDALTGNRFALATGNGPPNAPVVVPFMQPRLWTPDDPHLYDLEITLLRDGQPVDAVQSYAAFREVTLRKADDGFMRIHLNGEPFFMFGPLDQGWWPDGLYTAPTDDALKFDIAMTKRLGFNMCRKHVKVESARWYYWCDTLGLMVWQDMPSGDKYIGGSDPDLVRSAESETNFRQEWRSIIEGLYNHPSIVCWVPFNEGWGQFKTNEILDWTKSLDPTRLVDGPSGWADRGGGDLHDMHAYPGPSMFPISDDRASVLGEFGGLGLAMPGHLWQEDRNWGYRSFESQAELQREYENLIRQLRPLIARGLAAAVYTQTTDVEIEVNGFMTYDRAMIKLDPTQTAVVNSLVHAPPPIVTSILPTSQDEAQMWWYTTEPPDANWMSRDFDDSNWKRGRGGFGTAHTPGSIVGTKWKTNTIWLRRSFEFEAEQAFDNLYWRLHHDEDVEIYLNGTRVFERDGYITSYRDFPLGFDGVRHLNRGGTNTLAVKCTQTTGGQFIDVGIVRIVEDVAAGSRRR